MGPREDQQVCFHGLHLPIGFAPTSFIPTVLPWVFTLFPALSWLAFVAMMDIFGIVESLDCYLLLCELLLAVSSMPFKLLPQLFFSICILYKQSSIAGCTFS